MAARTLERGTRLVVASHNPGKVWEINALIRPYGFDAISASDLNLEEPEETETTFVGNAKLKALAAARAAGLPALADDSGLEVAALGGAPGIYSARWAGPDKDFSRAMEKVAAELTERHAWAAPGPAANFISVLCLAWPDGETVVFEGRVDGVLVWPPRGGNGFGYDPMFLADGEQMTFGEMDPDAKYAISHRTRAFAAFEDSMLAHLPKTDASPAPEHDGEGLSAAAANLSTRAELAVFVGHLKDDLGVHPAAWENADLARFFEAMQAWLTDSDALDDIEPKWRAIAQTLLAARRYE